MDFDLHDLPDLETLERFRQQYPDLDISALLCFLHFLSVSSDVSSSFNSFLASYQITQRGFLVLVLLARNPNGLSANELAEGTGVSRATMSTVLDTLERSGLVRRELNDKDRRYYDISISKEGQEKLETILPAHYRRVSRVFSDLDDTERQTLLSLLRKISRE